MVILRPGMIWLLSFEYDILKKLVVGGMTCKPMGSPDPLTRVCKNTFIIMVELWIGCIHLKFHAY